ncbi:M56 family metallopeptidase [Muriicola soli]|uniref:M56 family peptidase n=1 Tax=Muriicola soli TaxID=2507538 RepID=A0A411EB11_9FLAO|nr:M56 family metallopeptidase [Muriicola soli]QBA64717.1 M56 family peptidase [Muriicola soli]
MMEAFFEYLLKSSGILLIFYIVYLLLLQKETLFKENRRFLLLGLLCALLCPWISIPVYIEMVPVSISSANTGTLVNTASNSGSRIDPWVIGFIIYLAGLVFWLTKFGLQLWSLRATLSRAVLKRKEQKIRYLETDQQIAPFSFFNYIVYNPGFYNRTELDSILAHEKAHCEQKHSLDILISQLFTIILWINPMSFMYHNKIRQNLEFLADASAMNRIPSKKGYQYTMLKVSGQELPISIINHFYNSLIKKRIVMLQKSQSKKARIIKAALVVPALALFLFSFNTKEIYIPSNKGSDVSWEEMKLTKEIKIQINKDTTDEELAEMKEMMAEEGADFSYTVVRNEEKEIIELSINVQGTSEDGKEFNGTSDFNNDGEPIDPVTIVFDPEGKMMFMGGEGEMEFGKSLEKSKMTWIMEEDTEISEKEIEKMKEDGIVVIRVTEDENEWTDDKGNITKRIKVINGGDDKEGEKIIIKGVDGDIHSDEEMRIIKKKIIKSKDGEIEIHEGHEDSEIEHIEVIKSKGGKGKNVFIIKDSDDEEDIEVMEGNAFFFVDTEKGEKPLYVIDGKVVKEKAFSSLSPKDIATVNVYKGEKAIEKYGKKAKDGVVEVITKKD